MIAGLSLLPGSTQQMPIIQKSISKLKVLCHIIVPVGIFRTTKKVVQCYNYNLFHHFSRECNLATVCCKCTGKTPDSNVVSSPRRIARISKPVTTEDSLSPLYTADARTFPLNTSFNQKLRLSIQKLSIHSYLRRCCLSIAMYRLSCTGPLLSIHSYLS